MDHNQHHGGVEYGAVYPLPLAVELTKKRPTLKAVPPMALLFFEHLEIHVRRDMHLTGFFEALFAALLLLP